jgi:hypothetical protein
VKNTFKPIYRKKPLKIIFSGYTDVNEEMYISYYTRPDETQPVVMPLSNIQEIKKFKKVLNLSI